MHDPAGIDLESLKQIKFIERGRVARYCDAHPQARFVPSQDIWSVPCHVAIPAATQNGVTGRDAATLAANGCVAVVEAANMPTTPEGIHVFRPLSE